LQAQGHDVFSVYDEARGLNDDTIIEKAFADNCILITNDKDFGESISGAQTPQGYRASAPE
jgi:predicted nuclease of predicted toxin-antitoxin system